MAHNIVKKLYISSLFILLVLFTSYCITILGWFLNINLVNKVLVISFFIVTLFFLFLVKKKQISIKDFLISFISVIGIFILSYTIAGFYYDASFDGQWYHYQLVDDIMNKSWNPIKTTFPEYDCLYIYTNHYPKGVEVLAAIVASITKEIEYGKAINCLMCFVLLGFVLKFIDSFLPKTKWINKILVSFCILANPIIINQFFTFYIDYSMYILLTIAIISIYFLEKKRKENIVILFIVTVLSFAIKFTFAFWIGMLLCIYLIYLFYKKNYRNAKKIIFISLTSVIIGIGILGYSPYIINIKSDKHILYPLMGKDKIDILITNTPEYLQNKNRLQQVAISLFSRPENYMTQYTNPYKITGSNMVHSGIWDSRLGGFGLIFMEIFVLSIIMIFLSNKDNKRHYLSMIGVELLLLLSLFVLPGGWWARYVPFFWWFPIIVLLYSFKYGIKGFWLKYLMIVLIIANFTISFIKTSHIAAKHTAAMKENIELLDKNQPVRIRSCSNSFKQKLEERHIKTYYCDSAKYRLNVYGPDVFIMQEDIKIK